jgi:hypothetical protein
VASGAGKNSFVQRLIGAAALDAAIYEEVEADPSATSQAFLVVLLSSLAGGIGLAGGVGAGLADTASAARIGFFSALSLLAWATWAVVTFEIGTRILPARQTRADVGQLLRTIGFASTPGLLRILGIMPAVAMPVFAVTAIWMLAAMVVAVRQALDFPTTSRAIGVCVLGWVLALAITIVLGAVFGPSVS